jgi:WhiB family redox-sensing transcriptional regulator
VKPVFGEALVSFPAPGPWAELGACKGADPSMFFPVPGHTPTRAQQNERTALCGSCPVLTECTTYSVAWPDVRGFWAGMTEPERRGARALWRREKAAS